MKKVGYWTFLMVMTMTAFLLAHNRSIAQGVPDAANDAVADSKGSVQSPATEGSINFSGDNILIGKKVSILEDSNSSLTFHKVRRSRSFILTGKSSLDLGLSKSTYWIKFTVTNKTSNTRLMLDIENPTLSECQFYYPDSGGYKTVLLSNKSPISYRKYQHPDFLFDLILPEDSTATCFVRIKGTEQLILPMIIGNRLSIIKSKMDTQVLWGIFIGIFVVMAAYNCLLFLFTKDKSYLWYVLYCLSIGLTQTTLSGFTYHYLLGGLPWVLNKVIIIFPALAGIFCILFVKHFLETKKRAPGWHRLFIIPVFTYSLATLLRFAGFNLISFRLIDISGIVTAILMYIVAIVIARKGYRPAKYFLIAWSMFFVGILLYSLRNLGALPYNGFTSYTMGLGTVLELTLLSIALADRINTLKREKELSQAKALRIANENERIIRGQNTRLEAMVQQRTSDLNNALEELKAAETQMVQSEKMATLGQLTAGIAHEINNPINFVTSNVSPLKRDVEMLFGVIGHVAQLALSDKSIEEKTKELEIYQRQQDLEYLKMEVLQLISGIHNGATRTAEIVRGLKQFSRLDEDSLKFAALNEGIDSTMIILSNQLGSIKVTKIYGELPLVECYPGKLNQVFLNILSNAVYAIDKKFDKKPGGEITITTRAEKEKVVLLFEDNGTGMDDMTMSKIFNPFYTTKEVGVGTGLGMSISLAIIEEHGGSLGVNSEQGVGSIFKITLPVRPLKEAPQPGEPEVAIT